MMANNICAKPLVRYPRNSLPYSTVPENAESGPVETGPGVRTLDGNWFTWFGSVWRYERVSDFGAKDHFVLGAPRGGCNKLRQRVADCTDQVDEKHSAIPPFRIRALLHGVIFSTCEPHS
jgi:hypothetical protein